MKILATLKSKDKYSENFYEILKDEDMYLLRHTAKKTWNNEIDYWVGITVLSVDILVSFSKVAKYFATIGNPELNPNWYLWSEEK